MMSISSKPFLVKLFLIITCHAVLGVFVGFLFLSNEISLSSQITFSLIHIGFIFIAIKLLFTTESYERLPIVICLITVIGFLALNIVPQRQGLELHDSGFVPMWSMAPQTTFGWPCTMIRIFETDLQNEYDIMGDFLVQFDLFVLNIYIVTIVVLTEINVIQYLRKTNRG
jgi:hypothetical protein